MTYTISEFFLIETEEWKDTIAFRLEELEETIEWLEEIMRSDTIPNLASKVEYFLKLLSISRTAFITLKSQIADLANDLYQEQAPVTNEMISDQVKEKQKGLRRQIYLMEKSYLLTKYNCDGFLAETVIMQNRKTDGTSWS